MAAHVTLFGIMDDDATREAHARIRAVTRAEIREVACPPSMRDWYAVPFIEDEEGARYFGLEAISRFVSRQQSINDAASLNA